MLTSCLFTSCIRSPLLCRFLRLVHVLPAVTRPSLAGLAGGELRGVIRRVRRLGAPRGATPHRVQLRPSARQPSANSYSAPRFVVAASARRAGAGVLVRPAGHISARGLTCGRGSTASLWS